MQYWINVINYPLNIGGKPFHSWPSFIIVTFEMTILFGGISAVFGMSALNGLPMPYHPVFNVARFAMASKDRFFLIVFSSDKKYDDVKTREFLEGLGPKTLVRCRIKFPHKITARASAAKACRGRSSFAALKRFATL